MNQRTSVPEPTRRKLIQCCNNSCCICQHPYIVVHHIDGNRNNHEWDNLVGLCPNHHDQAHHSGGLSTGLNPERLKDLRDSWYLYCEKRKESIGDFSTCKLKLKNLARTRWPTYSWAKTFSSVDPEYAHKLRDEIIDLVFSTPNSDQLKEYLKAVFQMYSKFQDNDDFLQDFSEICNCFGISSIPGIYPFKPDGK